jgi:nucleoside-diphosphate-sugar epimerase
VTSQPSDPPVAVTGAAGFVGRMLVARLRARGTPVRALQHRAAVTGDPGITVVRGGVDDPAALARLVSGAGAVVHLAGLVAARRRADFDRVNAEGTARLAAAAEAAGVPRLLYVSTLAARAPHLSAYAASKRAGEVALGERAGLAWDVLRPPAVYGPGDVGMFEVFRSVDRGLAVLPHGEAGCLALVHVADLADATLAWLQGPPPSGAVYEVADAGAPGYRWRELLTAIAAELGRRPLYLSPPAAPLRLGAGLAQAWSRARGEAPFLTPDKIREWFHPDWSADPAPFAERTGWAPRVELTEGLRETVAWYCARGWLRPRA